MAQVHAKSLQEAMNQLHVSLKVYPRLEFLPIATSFVEKASTAFGLASTEALVLTLATEEVFAYLCGAATAGTELLISCRGRGYYVEEEIAFKAREFDMRAFNLTSASSFENDGGVRETGLLIASRMVDLFRFAESGERLCLTLLKEKAYPLFSGESIPQTKPLMKFAVRAPEPEELKALVSLTNSHYQHHLIPSSFFYPGKVVDMVAAGDYHAAVAVDERGTIGGGIVWRQESPKMVEFHGPYLFAQPAESAMAEALIDACLHDLARTDTLGLISRHPTPETPATYFEPLGSLAFSQTDGTLLEVAACYRHLEEDLGSAVWADPRLEPFLSREYRRLAFAREIRTVEDAGESSWPFSVLSAEFDRSQARVTLRPVWWGRDSNKTVGCHVEAFRREGLSCLLFEMDLGKAWQTRFTPALLDNGFEPRLIIPYGGTGDIVVFEHTSDGSGS
jgi:anti-sigma regulatory factor (Ser/Thr protein kinase)